MKCLVVGIYNKVEKASRSHSIEKRKNEVQQFLAKALIPDTLLTIL